MRNQVLVTGAGGLVGSHILNHLYTEGFDVKAVYHKNLIHNQLGDKLHFNLTDKTFERELAKISIDTLIHCAAAIPKTFFDKSALIAAEVNGKIDANIVNFCERRGIRLIYISGCSIYGLNHQEVKTEHSKVNPVGPYLEEKYRVEQDILNSSIPNPVILRVSSPYGYNQRNSNVLKLFFEKALKHEDIFFHGNGTREQDFINCKDTAIAVEKVVNNPKINGIFNIAYGRSITMKQLAEIITKTVKSNSVIRPSNQQDAQDGYKSRIDINKAKDLLGWEPRVSLEQGIDCWMNYLKTIT